MFEIRRQKKNVFVFSSSSLEDPNSNLFAICLLHSLYIYLSFWSMRVRCVCSIGRFVVFVGRRNRVNKLLIASKVLSLSRARACVRFIDALALMPHSPSSSLAILLKALREHTNTHVPTDCRSANHFCEIIYIYLSYKLVVGRHTFTLNTQRWALVRYDFSSVYCMKTSHAICYQLQ